MKKHVSLVALCVFLLAYVPVQATPSCPPADSCAAETDDILSCVLCCLTGCPPGLLRDCSQACVDTFDVEKGECSAQEASLGCTVVPAVFVPILSLAIEAPADGVAVITASGFFNIDHKGGGGLDDGYACISDLPSPPSPACHIAEFGFPSSLQTGRYRVPFSTTRTVSVTKGSNTWYLTAAKAGDAVNTLEVCQPQMSAVFVARECSEE